MVCQAGVPILVSGGGPPEGAEPNRADPTPRNPLTLQSPGGEGGRRGGILLRLLLRREEEEISFKKVTLISKSVCACARVYVVKQPT